MAELNLSQIITDYKNGVGIQQLASKYKMSEKELNEAIQKELCSNEKQDFFPRQELTLEDGTKISASLIKTVKQPKGGTVSLYIADDGKKYYQYVDKNGKQTKITDFWDSFGAAMDNLDVVWTKLQNKQYWDALTTLLGGAEDPTAITTGEAPAAGFAKGGFGLLKSMKNAWNFVKQLKSAKTFQQFKSIAVNILKQLGIRERLSPKSFINKNTKRPAKIYTIQTKKGAQLTKSYQESGVLYYDKKIPDGFRDAGHGAVIDENGKVINSAREIITVDRELDSYLTNAIKYAKNATKNMNEQQKLKFLYNLVRDISGDAVKGTKNSDKLAEAYKNREILLGDVFAKGAACCRHKSLLFKILAEEVGLNAKMIRGKLVGTFDSGGHVWNEIKLGNGKKFLVDTHNGALIDLDSPSKSELAYLKKYYYNQQRVY